MSLSICKVPGDKHVRILCARKLFTRGNVAPVCRVSSGIFRVFRHSEFPPMSLLILDSPFKCKVSSPGARLSAIHAWWGI